MSPPPPRTTTSLRGRPSSSSGTRSGSISDRHDYDKRKSRDDLYLMTMSSEQTQRRWQQQQHQQQQVRSFHVPIPSRPPLLDASPRNPARLDVPRSTSTPDHRGGLEVGKGNIAIGMALGSPSHPPTGSAWQPQLTSVFAPKPTPTNVPEPHPEPLPESHPEPHPESHEDTAAKSKSRMWGIFRSKSRAKRARANTATTPQPKSDMNNPSTTPTGTTTTSATTTSTTTTSSTATPTSGTMPGHPGLVRGNSVTVMPGSQPHRVVRSRTEPILNIRPDAQNSSQHNTRVAPAAVARKPVPTRPPRGDDRHEEYRLGPAAFHLPSRREPMLNIEIPDITMERYSVMFGQVLQREKPQQKQRAENGQSKEQQYRRRDEKSQQRDQPSPQPSSQPSQQMGHSQQEGSPAHPTAQPTQRQHTQQSPASQEKPLERSSSALLARRQATLSRLRTIEDEFPRPVVVSPPDLAPPRPLGSPQPQRKSSPTFHLFPPTPKATSVSSQTPSPRVRSNTSPAGLPSPHRTTPDKSPSGMANSRAHTYPRPASARRKGSSDALPASEYVERRPPQLTLAPADYPFPKKKPAPAPISESPTSMGDSPGAKTRRTASRPEGGWGGVISPPLSRESSANTVPKKGSVSSAMSSEHISVIKQPRPGEEAQSEKALEQAVEASITRQISVSREQRQMLGSLRGHMRRGRDDSTPRRLGSVAVGRNERLVDTRKLTPTLVHPGEDGEVNGSLHMHRRSERVVVEGV